MSRFLYPIRRLKVKPWIKYWMIKRTAGVLSEVMENLTSPITLNDSLKRRFKIFEIGGNSIQDGVPTPESPIPIQNVTGTVDVKVENKNLLDWDLLNERYIKNDDGTVTVTTSSYNGNTYKILTGKIPAGTYTFKNLTNKEAYVQLIEGNYSNAVPYNGKFTFNYDGKSYLRIIYATQAANTTFTYKAQLEQGSTATDYVKHEEQTVTFPTKEGQVLHLGDTLENDGVHQRATTLILTGQEIWNRYNQTRTIYYMSLTNKKRNSTDSFMSHFKNSQVDVFNMKVGEFTTKGGTGYYVSIEAEQSTTNEFKTWLAEQYANGTPVTLEYELAEEIIVPYNESQQEAYDKIKKLYSYQGTTHISSDNNPSPIFKIQYVKNENSNNVLLTNINEEALLQGEEDANESINND